MQRYLIHYDGADTGSGYASSEVVASSPEEALELWEPPHDDCDPIAWSIHKPGKTAKSQRLEAMKLGRLIVNYVVQHPDGQAPATDLNAAMIKRDGPAKKVTPQRSVPDKPARLTSLPCPFAKFVPTDLVPNTHQVNPMHGTAK